MKPKKILAAVITALLCAALAGAFALPAAAASAPNVATAATVTASSEYSADYAAWRCVHDGWAEHDSGTEWASKGEMTPWIRFEFPEAVAINQIILCDRSNLTDWSKIVKLTFDDGTEIVTKELDDDGFEYTVNFDLKNVSWVQIDVIEAGEISLNNGLGRVSMHNTNDAPPETEKPTQKPTEAPTAAPENTDGANETADAAEASDAAGDDGENSNMVAIVLVVVVFIVFVAKSMKKSKKPE